MLRRILTDIVAANVESKTHSTCLRHAIGEFLLSPQYEPVARLVKLSGEKAILVKDVKDKDNRTPLLTAINMFKKPNMTDLANQEALKKLKNIIELMIQVCPKALYNDSIGGSTVFSEFLSYYSNTSDSVEKNQLKSVLNVVKAAIIGDQNRSHQQRIQDIYPSGIPGMLLLRSICEHENNNEALALKICLDLGPSRAINSRFIDAMVNKVFDGVDFETVLSYVQLPPRQFTASPSAQGGELDTLENYARIFNFLMKDRKVQKIFKIIVNDLIGQPHPDEMITRLVYDFGVEYWDWKKLDMNIETILEAAPNVKEVSLHSSGIYSALQGWASEGGLIVLPKVSLTPT